MSVGKGSEMKVRVVAALASLLLVCVAVVGAGASAAVGKKQPRRCHPSYTGACLDPNASDYDCLGGSGNGPKYTGKVRVVGPDVFRLDADHDGWGCERD
jgi:hypothetical protein